MSLHISFDDFQKMVEKECQKQTGLTLADVPSVFCDDYWPEFDANKLQDIINEYLKRKRNFGKI